MISKKLESSQEDSVVEFFHSKLFLLKLLSQTIESSDFYGNAVYFNEAVYLFSAKFTTYSAFTNKDDKPKCLIKQNELFKSNIQAVSVTTCQQLRMS